MTELDNLPVTHIKGVGEKRAQLLAKLGVSSVGALLRFFPRAYEDWSEAGTLFDGSDGGEVCVAAKVIGGVRTEKTSGGRLVSRARAYDENGSAISLTFFNNAYIDRMLTDGEKYVFRGELTYFNGRAQMVSPRFVRADKRLPLVPVYPQTAGLDSRQIAKMTAAAAELCTESDDPLPDEMRRRLGLCSYCDAMRGIHCPRSMDEAKTARRRLAFDELLALELGMKLFRRKASVHTPVKVDKDCTGEFYSLLPFTPTEAQKRTVAECMSDIMNGGRPMARLVQGDVGSGKTAVAAALCYVMAKNGLQSAFMAPTEILAEQHYKTLSSLMAPAGVTVSLLTGSLSAAARREELARLADGSAQIAVGTHALISGGVSFARLGLAVTDEQHRFGVAQRAALSAKGESSHLLVMSATPIPRTLAMTVYGDLDLSVLDSLPSGRKPVKTYRVTSDLRQRVYAFARKRMDAGERCYIVCPLADEGTEDKASALEYYARLSSGEFEGYPVGLLHGKMKPGDKENVMRKFSSGEISLLISTTVVEVGVDVPEATVMIIENAERFGLSQLHQLRGRVGRGSAQSYCVMISDARGKTAGDRLDVLCATCDGFRIAEEDLKMRGPGDFLGSRQHGLPRLTAASLSDDMETVELAAREAERLLAHDPTLSLPEQAGLMRMVKKIEL